MYLNAFDIFFLVCCFLGSNYIIFTYERYKANIYYEKAEKYEKLYNDLLKENRENFSFKINSVLAKKG